MTLVLGEGRYDWLDLGIGLALTSLLAAHYRPSHSPPQTPVDRVAQAISFGFVSGLPIAMIASAPFQWWLVGTPERCLAAVSVDDCAGAATDPWVGGAWCVAGAIAIALHYVLVRTRPLASAAASFEPDGGSPPDSSAEPEPAS
ncbi:hypothetical protein ABZZ36_31465 [Actinacidiphila glaucinigra]|uniref:hypothetical protein n=1 Tax=Actinacidiphila glaucinigra TaxID=235986 RepID=UPI0033B8E188